MTFPAYKMLPCEEAAEFVSSIAKHCFWLESRLACGVGTKAELDYYCKLYWWADKAFWRVYGEMRSLNDER